MKRLLALLLVIFLITAHGNAINSSPLEIEEYGLTLESPKNWTLLYQDELDRRQALIGESDGESRGTLEEMDAEATIFVTFDAAGTTEIQLTAVTNEFSQDAFQLSRVPSDYKNSFIKGLQDGKESGLMGVTYSKSKYYQHPQAEFIRYEMSWELDDHRVIPMQKYYTIVNGVSFSVNLFCWDGDKSEQDEAFAQQAVDSMHWDEILTPTKDFLGYTSVSWSGALFMILGLLLVCGAIFAAYTYEDWRPIVVHAVKKIFSPKR